MLALRMVSLIEQHAALLTERVVHELRTDPRTPSYRELGPHEDTARVYAVIHNLSTWLDYKSDTATENSYRRLGQSRFDAGIPLAEVVCALMLTKQAIRRFIQAEGWMDSALDMCQQVELYTLIDRFFERAIYFTVQSYEVEALYAAKTAATPEPSGHKTPSHWMVRRFTNAV